MENYEHIRKLQHHSHVITTLNRQLEALTPLRFSHANLLQYHQKISHDLASLIEQHDFAITSLKANLHNLCTIGIRTQAQKNDMTLSLRSAQSQLAKMILDTRNMAQKYEALNQKLQLETARTDQNLAYQTQLSTIQESLHSHITSIETLIKDLQYQQAQSSSELKAIEQRTGEQEKIRATLFAHNDHLKSTIARINLKNDDMIDGNKKLSEETRLKEELCIQATKKNRELKETLIEQNGLYEKLKNQIDYKATLLTSETQNTAELTLHKSRLETIITGIANEETLVSEDNKTLECEIFEMQSLKQQDLKFRLNCENHLAELKQTNELLMSKMQQFCMQDQEVHNLMLQKMSSLEFFAKKLNQKYEFEQANRIQTVLKDSALFKQRALNISEMKCYQSKVTQMELKKSDSKKETKSSDKPWTKQNLCERL